MIKSRYGRDKFIDGLVMSFLVATCAAAVALNIGRSIAPGKILPVDISMRTAEMNENIVAGLASAGNDVASIKDGMDPAKAWSLISDHNLDLFFLIALLLPQSLTKAVLAAGYYLRFGAASAAMYVFCCRHAGLRRLYSFLLGIMYAFSAQVILTAQFAPVMNMVIFLPAALSAFDSYLRDRTWKAFSFSALACAMITASGIYGCISGIPFLAVAALILPIGLYSSKRKIFSSWFRLLAALLTGTAMASFTVIPRFIGMVPDFNVVESFKSAEMRYKLYDLLRHTFVAQSGGLEKDMAPVFYIGILTLEAIVLFWVNLKIPTRVKVTAAVILSVWYISCASSFVSEAVSIFGESTALSATRLICLEAFLFFYAAISLRNINGVSPNGLYAAFLVPMAFLVFSGNFYSDIKFSTTINLGTAIAMLVCGILIRHLTLNETGKRFKVFFAVLGAAAVTVNASFIMFNNTISTTDSDSVPLPVIDVSEDEIPSDDEDGLSVFSSKKRFLLLSEDISAYKPSGFADGLNRLSKAAHAGNGFEECKLKFIYSDQAEHNGGETYSVGKGFSSITFEVDCDKNEKLFVYSGFTGSITIRNTNGDFEEETDITGPTLVEIDGEEGTHELAFFFDLEEAEENTLVVIRAGQTAYDNLEKATREMPGNSFSFSKGDIFGGYSGPVSFVLSEKYDPALKVSVNGRNCRTFEYLGLTGCVFDGGEAISGYNVRVSRIIPGLSGGIALSAAVCLAMITIPVIYKYSNKNNKRGKVAEEAHAEQEDS